MKTPVRDVIHLFNAKAARAYSVIKPPELGNSICCAEMIQYSKASGQVESDLLRV
jgi:hypothetical protein